MVGAEVAGMDIMVVAAHEATPVVVSVAHEGMVIMAAAECRPADAVVEAADLVTAGAMVSRAAEVMAADMERAATVVAEWAIVVAAEVLERNGTLGGSEEGTALVRMA
jgi:hypothetical protein